MLEIGIIGGGIAGLGLAKHLKSQGHQVWGLEKQSRLGGQLEFGHHRVYTEEAREWWSSILSGVQWQHVTESPVQSRKGVFGPPADDFSEAERFYLGESFYQPTISWAELKNALVEELQGCFQLRAEIVKIDLEKRLLVGVDGKEQAFDQLIWCAGLAPLFKACGQTPPTSKKRKNVTVTGRISWDFQCARPLFEYRNAVVIPFRYKEFRFQGLGFKGPSTPDGEAYHWFVFLEEFHIEDREEVAKIVRAFKREVFRQFPSLTGEVFLERLALHTDLSGRPPMEVPSLELFPNLACVNAEIQQEGVRVPSCNDLRNLDLVARNCLDFGDHVLTKWVPTTPVPLLEELSAPLSS